MAYPNFLIIGASRCGTTWLHDMLAEHPQIFMSQLRKEVNFFNENFDRGWNWYESFFPVNASDYAAIGESTPIYLYSEEAAQRIAETESIKQLITILRNPLDRFISVYFLAQRYEGYNKPIEQFIDDNPIRLTHCLYAQHIRRYQDKCRNQPLSLLLTEDATADTAYTKATLSQLLGVDPARFPPEAGEKRVNEKHVPKLRKPYDLARRVAKVLRDQNLDAVVNWGHQLGAGKLFGTQVPDFPAPPSDDYMRWLAESFLPDVDELEALTQRDLTIWREKLVSVAENGLPTAVN